MLIKNGKVLIFEDGDVKIKKLDVRIKKDNIERIAEKIEPIKGEKTINATNKVIMPGLVNTHAHIAMSLFRATFEGCNLYTWLNDKVWPIEEHLTEEQVYNASMLSIVEMLSTGTTYVNDHYFISESIRKAVEDTKIRATITRVLMDNDGEKESNKRIQEFKKLYETRDNNNSLITYSVAPHSLYTCSDELLEISRKLALEYNLPIHIHFLESINEIDDIRKKHNDLAINVLKQHFAGIHTILAHGVKLNSYDLKELKEMKCGISHNPISNFRLGCKIADITKYSKEGINIGLGTDGQGSGNNLDMFETMKIAALAQGGIHENEERIGAKEIIKMATIGGAKIVGLDNEIGSIEVGKKADIIIVNTEPKLDNIKIFPNNNIISNLVYNTSGTSVETTIVNGKILMENRKFNSLNIQKIIEDVKNLKHIK